MTPGRVATFQWSIPGLEEQSNSMTLAVGIKSPLIAGHFRAIIVPKMSTAGNTGVFFENAGSDPVFLNLRLIFYLLWSFVKLKDRLFEKYNPTIKITKSTFFLNHQHNSSPRKWRLRSPIACPQMASAIFTARMGGFPPSGRSQEPLFRREWNPYYSYKLPVIYLSRMVSFSFK